MTLHDKESQQINRALESLYNVQVTVNTYVFCYWWHGGKPQILPEPETKTVTGYIANVPEATKKLVGNKLTELTGKSVKDDARLANDLGYRQSHSYGVYRLNGQ
jgi:hypothetical protein